MARALPAVELPGHRIGLELAVAGEAVFLVAVQMDEEAH
jgi:hypothetical protein